MSDSAPVPPAPATPPARGRKRRWATRWTRRVLFLGIAVVTGILVTFFTVDIGRLFSLRTRAEAQATKFIGRPLHIGKLSAYLSPGNFVLENVVIEGLSPDARPFLTAKKIFVHVPWWTMLEHQIRLDVRMTDWTMNVEQWADGHTNFPRFALPKPAGPSRYTTTVDAVYADGGEFLYQDHGTPWSVDARNLAVDIVHAPNLAATLGSQYVGRARFTGGTVQIQDFLPLATNLGASFVIDKGLVKLHRIDLVTDGSVSHVTGVVDLSHWPEQTYQVDSRLDFVRMREIFFAHERWRIGGEGHFQGAFHLYKGSRELKGDFASPVATLNEMPFTNLAGSLDWLPASFSVSKATAGMLGGETAFEYGIDGFGRAGGAAATFHAAYTGVDLGAAARYFDVRLIEMTGLAAGQATLAWRNGHFSETYNADGMTSVAPPEGREVATRDLPQPGPIQLRDDTFDPHKAIGLIPVGASLTYHMSRAGLEFDPSWVATPSTYAAFSGHVGPTGADLHLPVHITSRDWLASDRLLAAILAQRHAPINVIDVGGRGTFDGLMTESFTDLHTTGRFDGDALWAFGVRWPRAVGEVTIADKFVTVHQGVVGTSDAQRILVDGRFSIASDAVGDDLTGQFTVDHWPLTDFKTAFGLSYPIDGTASATLDLRGPYKALVGKGTLRIDQGSAWQEPFDTATSDLTFEGSDLVMKSVEMAKGSGRLHGTALIKWDNTYSFDGTGDHVALDSLHNFKVPAAPLTGELDFHVSGAGSFDAPSYTFQGHVADLYAGDEGVGDVTGTIAVKGTDLTLTALTVEGRVQATGQGRISLSTPYDAELTLTATKASIDPFLKYVMTNPPQLFRAVVSGSVRVAGPLADPKDLVIDTRLTDASLELFDYSLQNDGPIHLTYGENAVSIDSLNLRGNETKLAITGSMSRADGTLDLHANGEASLAILQAFKGFGDLRLGGGATIQAELTGDLDHPEFGGTATIHDGRLRFPSLRSLDSLNGKITFKNGDLDFSDLKGKMGGGDITFFGALRFDGLHPLEYQLEADGHNVEMAYPADFETTANATLYLRGPVSQPTLSGDVTITGIRYLRPLSTDAGLLLAAAGGGGEAAAAAPADQASDLSLAYDIHVHARSMPFIEEKEISIYGRSDDLTIRGTVNQPVVTGRIDLDRGEFFFNGNRFRLVAGSIDFANPQRTEPYFDIQATAQIHVQQYTYNINGRMTGGGFDLNCNDPSTCEGKFKSVSMNLSSQPPLSDIDIVTLLLGGSNDPNSVQRRTLDSPQVAQQQLVASMMAQLLTAPISSRVGSVVGNVIPLDTIQFVPLLGLDPTVTSTTQTSARVTLGKAVSDKVYLTYSRDITTAEEIYLLEYTQNDKVSWVLSRNEDHTFALDFRIRHIF